MRMRMLLASPLASASGTGTRILHTTSQILLLLALLQGFVTSIVEEAITGLGTLAQIGFDTPSTGVLALLCAVFGTATLVGTADTVRKLVTKKMTPGDIAR